MGWHTYDWRPRYQAVRYPDGRKSVTSGPADKYNGVS